MAAATRKAHGPSAGGQGIVAHLRAAQTSFRNFRKRSTNLMFLSPLGERLGEGVSPKTVSCITPSPSLSPKGERSMRGFRADMLHAFADGIEPSHHAVVDITAPIA